MTQGIFTSLTSVSSNSDGFSNEKPCNPGLNGPLNREIWGHMGTYSDIYDKPLDDLGCVIYSRTLSKWLWDSRDLHVGRQRDVVSDTPYWNPCEKLSCETMTAKGSILSKFVKLVTSALWYQNRARTYGTPPLHSVRGYLCLEWRPCPMHYAWSQSLMNEWHSTFCTSNLCGLWPSDLSSGANLSPIVLRTGSTGHLPWQILTKEDTLGNPTWKPKKLAAHGIFKRKSIFLTRFLGFL